MRLIRRLRRWWRGTPRAQVIDVPVPPRGWIPQPTRHPSVWLPIPPHGWQFEPRRMAYWSPPARTNDNPAPRVHVPGQALES